MHINISKHRVANGEDLLQDVYFFIYAFILIYLRCAKERKQKTLSIPIELVEERKISTKKKLHQEIKSNKKRHITRRKLATLSGKRKKEIVQ